MNTKLVFFRNLADTISKKFPSKKTFTNSSQKNNLNVSKKIEGKLAVSSLLDQHFPLNKKSVELSNQDALLKVPLPKIEIVVDNSKNPHAQIKEISKERKIALEKKIKYALKEKKKKTALQNMQKKEKNTELKQVANLTQAKISKAQTKKSFVSKERVKELEKKIEIRLDPQKKAEQKLLIDLADKIRKLELRLSKEKLSTAKKAEIKKILDFKKQEIESLKQKL